jgi:general secretion pathway protein G
MFCRDCGTQMADNSEVCPACKRPQTLQPVKNKGLGGCAIAAIVGAVLLFFMITIGGILAAVAVPKFAHMVKLAKMAQTKADSAEMKSAVSRYFSDTGRWPESIDELVEKKYIEEIPAEKVTGSKTVRVISTGIDVDIAADAEPSFIDGNGGWVYLSRSGEVYLNLKGEDEKGKAYWKYGYE